MGENQPLPGCKNDVTEMGMKLEDCKFSVNSRFNLNRRQMNEELDTFLEKVDSNDIILFYFSGHGVEYRGVQYFIPIDMDDPEKEEDIMKTAFSCDLAIKKIAKKVRKGLKLIISDSCRSEFKKVLNNIGLRTGNTYDSINIDFNPNRPDKEFLARVGSLEIGPNIDETKSLCAGFSGQPPTAVTSSFRKSSVESLRLKREIKNIVRMCAVTRGEKADAGYGNNLSYYTKALVSNITTTNQSIISLNIRICKEFEFGDAKPEIAIIAPDEIVDSFRFKEQSYISEYYGLSKKSSKNI